MNVKIMARSLLKNLFWHSIKFSFLGSVQQACMMFHLVVVLGAFGLAVILWTVLLALFGFSCS